MATTSCNTIAALAVAASLSVAAGAAAQSLPAPTAPAAFPASSFQVAPDVSATPEAIQGKANFKKVRDLPTDSANFKLSTKVGQIFRVKWKGEEVEGLYAHCTGSLIAPNLMLTNQHCVDDGLQPKELLFVMENLQEKGKWPKGSFTFAASFVRVDAFLDFAVVELLRPLGDKYGWLDVETVGSTVTASKAVKIIQHPAGRTKEIVTDDTEVVRVHGKFLHYLADTEGGSSGSPVFDLNGDKIIALHHVGTNQYNEGARMDAIAQIIAPYLPDPGAPQQTSSTPAAAPSASETNASTSVGGGSGGGGWKAITGD